MTDVVSYVCSFQFCKWTLLSHDGDDDDDDERISFIAGSQITMNLLLIIILLLLPPPCYTILWQPNSLAQCQVCPLLLGVFLSVVCRRLITMN